MQKYVTPGGKELECVYAANTALLKIRFVGGGELPAELSGLFTDERQVEAAIISYLEKSKVKKAA